MASPMYQLINKPWEWRKALAAYRERRDAQWELAEFWRRMRLSTCAACLREMRAVMPWEPRICSDCWSLLASSRAPTCPRESIRVRRGLDHLEVARL